MGVSYFYKNLISQYPEIRAALAAFLEENKDIFLYIDFNGMIHPCVNRVIDSYMKKDGQLDREQMQKDMFAEIRKNLTEVIEKMNPKFLMIAVDGVAPRAKMEQQRLRRYTSVANKDRNAVFNTNCISPGTQFMIDLDKNIRDFIETELEKKCKVLYSPHTRVGEGEHKAIKWIKNVPDSINERIVHVIYGLDADLVMLSLTTGLDNIFLLREKTVYEHKEEDSKKRSGHKDEMEHLCHLLSIKKMKDTYWAEANLEYDYSVHITKEQFFKDYVMMSFLLGNDFMPHMKALNIYKGGLEKLIEKYLEGVKTTNRGMLDEKLGVNKELLLIVLKEFYDNEPDYVKSNKTRWDEIHYDQPGWGRRHYSYYLGNRHNKQDIDRMCYNFWEIFTWNTKYYFNQHENWSAYYRYPTGPLIRDLYENLQRLDLDRIQLPRDAPYSSDQQLMIIFPPQSKMFVPEKYHYIYQKYSKFYPMRFKLDKQNKHAQWQWRPMLPLINDKMIKDLVQ